MAIKANNFQLNSLMKRIEKNGKITLYHGSRGGIKGNIEPKSRLRCDFGSGFYMGTNPEQTKGLVVEDASPVFYTLEVDFSIIPKDKILFLDGTDWLYTIMAFREKSKEFSELKMAKEYINTVQKYDFVIGNIADDRMNEAIKAFTEYSLTDQGLEACLASIDYGIQILARTEEACKTISIVSERDIFGKEADDIRRFTQEKRAESRNIITEIKKQYQRKGYFLNEILETERERENDYEKD